MASPEYRVTVPEESVIGGNSALIKCSIPSFVADFVSVTAWVDSEGLELTALGFGNETGGWSLMLRPCCFEVLVPLAIFPRKN